MGIWRYEVQGTRNMQANRHAKVAAYLGLCSFRLETERSWGVFEKFGHGNRWHGEFEFPVARVMYRSRRRQMMEMLVGDAIMLVPT